MRVLADMLYSGGKKRENSSGFDAICVFCGELPNAGRWAREFSYAKLHGGVVWSG
jgi:hypothetical protein